MSGHSLPNGVSSLDDVAIALMGPTGAGKSTFIKRVTGRSDIQIGHDLTSETLDCKAYNFTEAGTSFALVDTPGFNDTYLDDAAILAQLAAFMESSYKARLKLTAIIYLHPITSHRLEGSALNNLSMFRKLCGSDFYPNVILATSFWSQVDHGTGERRELELRTNDEFWGTMVKRGSQMKRLPDDRAACVQLLMSLAHKGRATLQIQKELVDQGLSINQTQAGASAKNTKALEELRHEFSQRIAALGEERKAEIARREAEFAKIQAEQEAAFEAQVQKHKDDMEAMRRKHEALLREREQKRDQAVKEHEELMRKQQEETERVRAELERLATREREEAVERQRQDKEQTKQAAWKQILARMLSQKELCERAVKAGTVKAQYTADWPELMGRYCDHCLHICGSGVSYTCSSCADFDICSDCFDRGLRCTHEDHNSFPRRNLIGTDAGQCRRARYPTRKFFRIPCDGCNKMFQRGEVSVHCCSCASDNYDLCVDCIVKGKTCLNTSHVMHYMYI